MSGKDKVESGIAITIIGTFCYLSIIKIIPSEAFVGIAVYVVKKFLDGIESKKK